MNPSIVASEASLVCHSSTINPEASTQELPVICLVVHQQSVTPPAPQENKHWCIAQLGPSLQLQASTAVGLIF